MSADDNLGATTGTFNGGTLQFSTGFDLASTRAITLNAGGGTIDTNGSSTTTPRPSGGRRADQDRRRHAGLVRANGYAGAPDGNVGTLWAIGNTPSPLSGTSSPPPAPPSAAPAP